MRLSVAIFVCGCIGFSQPSLSATFTSELSKEGKVIIILSGTIEPGDADQLQKIIRDSNNTGRVVSAIRLNSTGGNLLEGAKLADMIRFAKMDSVVVNGATCASACFLAFAAGVEKYASYSSSIGVHGASDADGNDTDESKVATVGMAKAAKILGVPSEIIGKMVVTPPSEIIWLSPNDLRAMGTIMTGRQIQTQAAPVPAQLPANSSTTQTESTNWDQLVNGAIALSSSQHNGKPIVTRVCQPEIKSCVTGVFFTNKDGRDELLKVTEDEDGHVTTREVCQFNEFGDVRFCVDWDNGKTHKDMKDSNGNWSEIGVK